jgi:hypothetical protein
MIITYWKKNHLSLAGFNPAPKDNVEMLDLKDATIRKLEFGEPDMHY